MKDLLVGSTGFVGGNLKRTHEFDDVCHASDVEEYYSYAPELCVYAGVPSAMFLANSNPAADLEIMKHAQDNLRRINPRRLVLISSIAVYRDSRGKDETSIMETTNLSAYGKNRLQLEQWVRQDFPDALIVRLPALYGDGLKKNFLFDLHTVTPSMLKPELYMKLAEKSDVIRESYDLQENGFYVLKGDADQKRLKDFFSQNDFNALSFTDSRSNYQFYNLNRLWHDIEIGLENQLKLLNICTPPVSAGKVYEYLTGGEKWVNELSGVPFDYDMRTVHYDLFNGANGYLCTLEEELHDIKQFMTSWR